MLDIEKDLEKFSNQLAALGIKSIFADSIINSIVDQLVSENCKSGSYGLAFPIKLNRVEILTIQRFLSEYNFHIEYQHQVGERSLYSIVPNWKK